jgi:hypothetical protein
MFASRNVKRRDQRQTVSSPDAEVELCFSFAALKESGDEEVSELV